MLLTFFNRRHEIVPLQTLHIGSRLYKYDMVLGFDLEYVETWLGKAGCIIGKFPLTGQNLRIGSSYK